MSNKAFQRAERDGYDAGLDGLPASCCPYQDTRKADGRLTFSRAFLRAWNEGWRRGKAERDRAGLPAKAS